MLNKPLSHAPRVAIIDDCTVRGCRLLVSLIEQAGGTAVIIPRTIADLFLITAGVPEEKVALLRQACKRDEIRGYEVVIEKALNHHLCEVRKLLDSCDAIIFPGNMNDVPPSRYKESFIHPETKLPTRLDFRVQTEQLMLRYTLNVRQLPVLGICGGMQLMVTETGGKLVQHLPDLAGPEAMFTHNIKICSVSEEALKCFEAEFRELISRQQAAPVEANHAIHITTQDSLLAQITHASHRQLFESDFDGNRLGILSFHHQGAVAEGINQNHLLITALAEDGVVEGVEHKEHPFFVGVQFHPEYNTGHIGLGMVQELVRSALILRHSHYNTGKHALQEMLHSIPASNGLNLPSTLF